MNTGPRGDDGRELDPAIGCLFGLVLTSLFVVVLVLIFAF